MTRQFETQYGPFRISDNDKKMLAEFEAKGGHQLAEIDWLLSLVPTGGKVLDIGAHVGTFAVPLSRKAHVVACEPHPDSFALLKENTAENNADVALHNVAIGERGETHLLTVRNDGGSRLAEEGQYTVNVVPLDDFYDEYNLIKIDVEGYEYDALKTGPKTLAHKPIIFFEVGDNTGLVRRLKLDWLLRGYRFYRRHKQAGEIERVFSTLLVSFADILAVPKDDQCENPNAKSNPKHE